MITAEKLAIFERLRGNCDSLDRRDPAGERSGLSSEECDTIGSLIGEMVIVVNGRASSAYAERVHARLDELVEDDETKARIQYLATTGRP